MESQESKTLSLAKLFSDEEDKYFYNFFYNVSRIKVYLDYDYEACKFMAFLMDDRGSRKFEDSLRKLSFKITEKGFASYFASIKDYERNKRTEKKIGKFIKEGFPDLSDSKVESIVAQVKACYSTPEYELIHGSSESDFLAAYTGKVISRPTPSWGYNESSLTGSCMQGKFSANIHPCKAYASGDFSIVYVKQKETGLIGARVIVGNDTAGPIYSACDVATKQVEAYLKEKEIGLESDWEGLSLSAIPLPSSDNEYLMPYVDNYDSFYKEDDSIVIGYGENSFDFATTFGVVRIKECETYYCDSCGEWEESTNETDSGCVCDGCLSNYYTYSNLMGLYTYDETLGETYDGRFASQEWFENNEYILNEDGFYYPSSECVYIEDFGEYYHKSNYSVFERNGVLYHEDSEEGKAILAKEKEAAELPFLELTPEIAGIEA